MSTYFGAMCDEFFVSTRLYLKLELPKGRETVLHFFERIRRDFPALDRMRRRRNGSLILEQDDGSASRMWVRLDPTCLRFGHVNPPDSEAPRDLAAVVLEQAPYHLTLTDLDIDRMEYVYSFDLDYSGNHDQLVAETLLSDHPFASFLSNDRVAHVTECQPCFGVALSPDCELQAYVDLRSRSTTYDASRGQFEPRPLTVNLSVRRYRGVGRSWELIQTYDELRQHADHLAADRVIPLIVNPLAHAIASRP